MGKLVYTHEHYVITKHRNNSQINERNNKRDTNFRKKEVKHSNSCVTTKYDGKTDKKKGHHQKRNSISTTERSDSSNCIPFSLSALVLFP